MLFWTKFLTITHGVAQSVHLFLPLYFFHLLHFNYFQIAVLLTTYLTTRSIACGFWTAWVDQHATQLHGVLTSLLTALGAASLVLVLSIPPDTWIALPAAILCMMLDGWFFQPLGVLVDSVIIKILGDYKLLYESERRWGKLSLGLTAIGIGCFLDDDHDFDTLMGTMLVGCMGLFLLSLSTTVQPADPLLLGLKMENSPLETSPLLANSYYDDDELTTKASPLHHDLERQPRGSTARLKPSLKSSLSSPLYHQQQQRRSTTSLAMEDAFYSLPYDQAYPSYYHQKPYRYYHGDQLSHISEEDASMLQRMASTITPRAPSILSTNNKSLDFLLDNSTFQFCSSHPQPVVPPSPLGLAHLVLPPSNSDATLTSSSSLPSLVPPGPSPNPPCSCSSSSSAASPPPPWTSWKEHRPSLSSMATSPTTSHTSSLLDLTFMSMTLALLPLPPSDVPMVVLITWFPRFQPVGFSMHRHQPHVPDRKQSRQSLLMMISSFLFGLVTCPLALWAPLIYYDYFLLPMHTIGLLICVTCLVDVLITSALTAWLDRLTLRHLLLLSQLCLFLGLVVFAWLPVGDSWSNAACLFCCHALTTGSMQTVWLLMSYQVDLLNLANCQDRMMLRGKVSVLYSSLGPVLGSLCIGYV
ncbi:hypothetical protein DM01DRAFT_1387221, partial [Hesseltinella vesiculosa]